MQTNFVVHTVVQNKMPATVHFQGEEVRADIDCLEVELIPVNQKNGSLILRYTGADITAAKELFVQDKVISGTFAIAN